MSAFDALALAALMLLVVVIPGAFLTYDLRKAREHRLRGLGRGHN